MRLNKIPFHQVQMEHQQKHGRPFTVHCPPSTVHRPLSTVHCPPGQKSLQSEDSMPATWSQVNPLWHLCGSDWCR